LIGTSKKVELGGQQFLAGQGLDDDVQTGQNGVSLGQEIAVSQQIVVRDAGELGEHLLVFRVGLDETVNIIQLILLYQKAYSYIYNCWKWSCPYRRRTRGANSPFFLAWSQVLRIILWSKQSSLEVWPWLFSFAGTVLVVGIVVMLLLPNCKIEQSKYDENVITFDFKYNAIPEAKRKPKPRR
jgi:hypothetical protein